MKDINRPKKKIKKTLILLGTKETHGDSGNRTYGESNYDGITKDLHNDFSDILIYINSGLGGNWSRNSTWVFLFLGKRIDLLCYGIKFKPQTHRLETQFSLIPWLSQ